MKNKIRETFNDIVSLPRWKIYSEKKLTLEDNPIFPITAKISHNWDKMQISVHKNLDEIIKTCTQFYLIEDIFEDPLKDIMQMLIAHEEGHWKICPFDSEYFEDILAGSYEGLKESGFSSSSPDDLFEKSGLLNAMKHTMGTFEDIIVNSVLSIRDKENESINRGHFLFDLTYICSPFFQATEFNTIYADVNARLSFYRPELYAPLTIGFVQGWPKLEKDIIRTINAFCPNIGLAYKVSDGTINSEEKISLARYMSNPKENRWYKMSKDYARVIGPYLKEEQDDIKDMVQQSPFMILLFGDTKEEECMDYFDNSMDIDAEPSQSKEHEGEDEGKDSKEEDKDKSDSKKSEELKINTDKEIEEQEINSQEESDLDNGINKDFLEHLVSIGIEKGREVNYANKLSYLDKLYEKRADNIIVNIIEDKRDDLSTRIADMTSKIMTADNIDIKRVQWHKSRFIRSDTEKKLLLYRGELPLEAQDPSSPGKNSVPDIALIADSSRSMIADLKKGDKKPYDLLLRGKWALFNWLKRTGKGYHMNFASINFSNQTCFSGWHPYEELDQVKKHLLRFQNGGTYLNSKIIKELYENRRDPFLAILTTDGELEKPKNTINELKNLVDKGNYLALISIQTQTRQDCLVKELRDYADIHVINDPIDMIGIDISYAKRFWGDIKR